MIDGAPHIPVLLNEVISGISPKDGGIYVDGTFGAGGYTRAVLTAANCKVIAIDRDPDAVRDGQKLCREFEGRLTLLHGEFGDMVDLVRQTGTDAVDGVMLDIGVSSMQVDQAERGFSFKKDGFLDMRMSRQGLSAADVVNTALEENLVNEKTSFTCTGKNVFRGALRRRLSRAAKKKPLNALWILQASSVRRFRTKETTERIPRRERFRL